MLQRDTLAQFSTLYQFIICLDCVLRASIDKMKDNGFKRAKERSRRNPEETITEAVYADDIALLANTHAQAETLLNRLESCLYIYIKYKICKSWYQITFLTEPELILFVLRLIVSSNSLKHKYFY